jgi:PHD/YefM family antitoxin component YafN of YafNO toxin-antitoxin module
MTKAQFITDTNGNKVSVIVSLQDYEKMLSAMEELEDISAYDKAKNSNNEFIQIDEAFEQIEKTRLKYALSSTH